MSVSLLFAIAIASFFVTLFALVGTLVFHTHVRWQQKLKRGDKVTVLRECKDVPGWLEIEAGASPEVEQFLIQALDLIPPDVYRVPWILDLTGFFQIYGLLGYPALRDPQAIPQPVPEFSQATNCFNAPGFLASYLACISVWANAAAFSTIALYSAVSAS